MMQSAIQIPIKIHANPRIASRRPDRPEAADLETAAAEKAVAGSVISAVSPGLFSKIRPSYNLNRCS
jgi:hypothetical protein